MNIRPMKPSDASAWLAMRCALFTDGTRDEHLEEIHAFFAGGDRRVGDAVFGAFDPAGTAVGFVELSIRSHAEGCYSGRVGYLEGWYVVPDFRGMGVGRELVEASFDWARAQGCTEFASDTAIGNDASEAAHQALGFEETDRLITFRKSL